MQKSSALELGFWFTYIKVLPWFLIIYLCEQNWILVTKLHFPTEPKNKPDKSQNVQLHSQKNLKPEVVSDSLTCSFFVELKSYWEWSK